MTFANGAGHYFVFHDFTINDCLMLIVKFLVQQRFWTLWFVAALFFLNILFYVTFKILKTNGKLVVFAIFSTLAGLLYYYLGGIPLPWNIDVCFTAYPFFLIGYIYKVNSHKVDKYLKNIKISVLLFILCLIINICCSYLSFMISGSFFDMNGSFYGVPPLVYLSAFAGIAVIIFIAKWTTIKPIIYIGKNSMLYYQWHHIIVMQISILLLNLIGLRLEEMHTIWQLCIYNCLLLFIILIILTVCSLIISKSKLKFMLGRW